MYLKKAFWSESSPEAGTASPIIESIKTLERQRLYRELTLSIRAGLREARAEFSFLRIRGLRSLLKFLQSVAQSEATIDLFHHSQSIPQLQGMYDSDLFDFFQSRESGVESRGEGNLGLARAENQGIGVARCLCCEKQVGCEEAEAAEFLLSSGCGGGVKAWRLQWRAWRMVEPVRI
ncbi:binding [Striga hermonthica]|uniref:Binding n=1 Tax=Striga hermonthica TaxID=68872 RepID=A0A9N7NY04_STRHE|nr:binding [Striga hermonthica]